MISKPYPKSLPLNIFNVLISILRFYSVEKLTEVARHHIESSTKIQFEMVLEETDFFISSEVKVIPDPVPQPHPPPAETSANSALTTSQLSMLHKQFLQLAPKGREKYSYVHNVY